MSEDLAEHLRMLKVHDAPRKPAMSDGLYQRVAQAIAEAQRETLAIMMGVQVASETTWEHRLLAAQIIAAVRVLREAGL